METARLEALKKNFEESLSKWQQETKTVFTSACQGLFDEYPKLESFGWHQYTPYFNDGDECIFTVYADHPEINGVDTDDEEELNGLSSSDVKQISKIISKLVYTVPKDMLKAIFGDHVSVTIFRNGKAETSGYPHD